MDISRTRTERGRERSSSNAGLGNPPPPLLPITPPSQTSRIGSIDMTTYGTGQGANCLFSRPGINVSIYLPAVTRQGEEESVVTIPRSPHIFIGAASHPPRPPPPSLGRACELLCASMQDMLLSDQEDISPLIAPPPPNDVWCCFRLSIWSSRGESKLSFETTPAVSLGFPPCPSPPFLPRPI